MTVARKSLENLGGGGVNSVKKRHDFKLFFGNTDNASLFSQFPYNIAIFEQYFPFSLKNTVKSRLFQVSFISSGASRVFQVLRSPPRSTISLSRDALEKARKK